MHGLWTRSYVDLTHIQYYVLYVAVLFLQISGPLQLVPAPMFQATVYCLWDMSTAPVVQRMLKKEEGKKDRPWGTMYRDKFSAAVWK